MLSAIIFDMDGVLVDDERFHQEAWRVYCRKKNLFLKEEDFKHNVNGKTSKDILNYLYKHELSTKELEIASLEKIDITIELLKDKVKPTEGLLDFLKRLYLLKIPMAVATSSKGKFVDFILDELGIKKYFRVIVTGYEVNLGKPNPEIYLKTSERLRVNPENCIVFEDSIAGIKAANAAGMKVIGITTTHSKDELTPVHLVIDSFMDMNIDKLEEMLRA